MTEEPPFGMDVGAYHLDIRRIFFHFFARSVINAGLEPEDVLQEIYLGIHRRQKPGMKSAYDPDRSSPSHYIHISCRSLMLHQIEKEDSRRRRLKDAEELEAARYDTAAATQGEDRPADPFARSVVIRVRQPTTADEDPEPTDQLDLF